MKKHILIALVGLALPALAQAGTIFFNEFHYDNTGTDTGEFIEVAVPTGTSLAGFSVVLYNGADGAVYDTQPLSAFTAGATQGSFTLLSKVYPSNGIQNGSPDGMALVSGSSVLQFLSYEGSFMATGGPANGLMSTDIGVSESAGTAVGASLGLQGTGNDYGDFAWIPFSDDTPGSVNAGQTLTTLPIVVPLPPAVLAGSALLGFVFARKRWLNNA